MRSTFLQSLRSVDTWSGVLCLAFGAVFVGMSSEYDLGSAAAMGPGHFPIWLGGALMAFGIALVIKVQIGEPEQIGEAALSPAFIVIGALVVFSVLLERVGLFLAGLVLIYLGSFATPSLNGVRLALFGVGLVLFVALIFVYGLGLAVPLWPRFGA